jgi:DNA-binding response OmpR family regulator
MARINRLLVVEDDGDLRETLVEQIGLCSEFEVESVDNAGDARRGLQKDRIDLVIMDVGLPDMDGREAVRLIRQDGYRGPIIMLTAQASDADVVTGLDAGANDYVAKPFKFAVLLARIRAQLRTHEASEDAVFKIGPTRSGPAPRCWSARKGRS